MPIGKNALKRVSNNGYSNVKATAPDMENSEIIEAKPEIAEAKPEISEAKPEEKESVMPVEKSETVKKAEPKAKSESKPAEKTASVKKKTASKKADTAKEDKPTENFARPDGFVKISFGMDMPVYLL